MTKFQKSKIICLVILFGGFFGLAGSAQAAEWYVDNAATGANNGTSWVNAWNSFASIVWSGSGVKAGDTLYISGGSGEKIYNETLSPKASGTDSQPIFIRPGQDTGHNGIVIISAANDYGIYSVTSSGQNITYDGSYGGQIHMRITGCGKEGIFVTNPIRNLVFTNLEVDHNGLNDKGLDGIELNNIPNVNTPRIIEFKNSKIHDNHQDQMHIVGFRGPEIFGRVLVHDNEIFGLHDDGVEVGIRGFDFYNNRMHTFGGHLNPGDHPDGVATMAGFTRIFNNYLSDFSKDGDSFGNILYPSLFSNSLESERSIYVYNNHVSNSQPLSAGDWGHKGIEFAAAKNRDSILAIQDVLIANNTFSGMPSFGISFVLSGYSSDEIDNIRIYNNIFYNCLRLQHNYFGVFGCSTEPCGWTAGSDGDAADVTFDYNIISAGAEGGTGSSFAGVNYSSYPDWKAATGFQKHITGTPDPLLAANGKVLAGSPVIDNGLNLSEILTDDISGIVRPQGAGWDIGAYEYVTGDAVAPAAPSGLSVS